MAATDTTPYVDLTLEDRDPQQIVAAAIAAAAEKLPGWVPNEGHVEVVLLELLALEAAEMVHAINRVPGAVMEVLLALYGVPRDAGAAPTADVTFTAADTLGHDIPAGTRVQVDAGLADPLVMQTTAAVVIPAGSSTATAAAAGLENTTNGNGVASGTAVQVLDALSYIDSAVLATAVTGGRGPEESAAYLDRGRTRLTRLTESLVLPDHFTAYVLELPDVARAYTIDSYDPATAGAGDDPGHVTVVVLGAGGVTLSAAARETIRLDLETRSQVNLAVHVVDPTITAVNVTATVRALPGANAAAVQAAAVAALQDHLSAEGWEWGATIRRFELVSVLDHVAGVDYVESITTPAADVALAGTAPLPTPGVLTITVTAAA